jgi:glutaredoxin
MELRCQQKSEIASNFSGADARNSQFGGAFVNSRTAVLSRPLRGQRILQEPSQAFGSLLLFVGMGLLALLLIDRGELPIAMPSTWYSDRTLWVAGGLAALGVGWYLLRDSTPDTSGRTLSPQQTRFDAGLGPPLPRFSQVVLYTRTGCHLCDDARATLERYRAYLPAVTEVDIDGDPGLIERFTTCVPVVEFDGKVRFRGRVHELLLRRLIAATPPRSTTQPGDDL